MPRSVGRKFSHLAFRSLPGYSELIEDHEGFRFIRSSRLQQLDPEFRPLLTRKRHHFRGKRASSTITGLSVLPHPSVGHGEFYRHISPGLPGSVRMRQLLVWILGTIALDEAHAVHVRHLAKTITEGLICKEIQISWHKRSGACTSKLACSNPRMEELGRLLSIYSECNQRLERERHAWNKLRDGPSLQSNSGIMSTESKGLEKQWDPNLKVLTNIRLWIEKLPWDVERIKNSLSVIGNLEQRGQQLADDFFRSIFGQSNTEFDTLCILKAFARSNVQTQ